MRRRVLQMPALALVLVLLGGCTGMWAVATESWPSRPDSKTKVFKPDSYPIVVIRGYSGTDVTITLSNNVDDKEVQSIPVEVKHDPQAVRIEGLKRGMTYTIRMLTEDGIVRDSWRLELEG